MNQMLSKEDLEARALNVNIHNHCMFLFASLLKRCHMGNYYRQRNAFTFRESAGNELSICDAVYSDDYDQVLVIEIKTRLIRDSQVDVNEAIKVDILKELKPMLYSNYFIVPIFMYTTDQRDLFNFRDAKVMIYYGNDVKRMWAEPRTLAAYYEDVKDSGSIHDLFNNLSRPQPTTLPNNARCVKLELMPSTPAKQTTPTCPKISRRLKSKYFYIRYDQKPLNGWAHLEEIMLDSGFYDNSQRATHNILRSLASAVGTGAMNLVIKWRGDMFDLDKDMLEATMYKNTIRYGFNPHALEMLKDSDVLIMFMNEKHVPNKADFKRFNEYMDSISGNLK